MSPHQTTWNNNRLCLLIMFVPSDPHFSKSPNFVSRMGHIKKMFPGSSLFQMAQICIVNGSYEKDERRRRRKKIRYLKRKRIYHLIFPKDLALNLQSPYTPTQASPVMLKTTNQTLFWCYLAGLDAAKRKKKKV